MDLRTGILLSHLLSQTSSDTTEIVTAFKIAVHSSMIRALVVQDHYIYIDIMHVT